MQSCFVSSRIGVTRLFYSPTAPCVSPVALLQENTSLRKKGGTVPVFSHSAHTPFPSVCTTHSTHLATHTNAIFHLTTPST
jgi:hypothetical protein